MHPVFTQAIYYGIVMILVFGFVSVLQKGFFLRYAKVRCSFGRLIMVKIRAVNRDYFRVGRIEEGFLVYKYNKEDGEKRIPLPDNAAFYRSLAITWIDVDEQKNAICRTDYSTIEGFDAIKFNNLLLRALYKPPINDDEKQRKIMFILLIGIGITALVIAFLSYSNYTALKAMTLNMQGIQSSISAAIAAGKGTVIASGAI